jgi:hypothetical protein
VRRAARSRDTYLSAQYWQLARRIGKKKAAVAVGHSILVIAWHLLTDDCDYQDLGGDYFVRRDTDQDEVPGSSPGRPTTLSSPRAAEPSLVHSTLPARSGLPARRVERTPKATAPNGHRTIYFSSRDRHIMSWFRPCDADRGLPI